MKLIFIIIVLFNFRAANADSVCTVDPTTHQIDPTASFSKFFSDISCRTSGTISQKMTIYQIGLCKSQPVIATAPSSSDLSSCTWIVNTPYPSAGQTADLASGSLLNLSISQTPSAGVYPYTIFIASNQIDITASVTFNTSVEGKSTSGPICYTNGGTLTEAGVKGPFFNGVIKEFIKRDNFLAECSSSSNAVANHYNYQYIDVESKDETHGSVNGMDVYLVDGNYVMPAQPFHNSSDIGVKQMIGVYNNSVQIYENTQQGNLTCNTQSLDMQVGVDNALMINMFSNSPWSIEDFKLGGLKFGFAAQNVCQ